MGWGGVGFSKYFMLVVLALALVSFLWVVAVTVVVFIAVLRYHLSLCPICRCSLSNVRLPTLMMATRSLIY